MQGFSIKAWVIAALFACAIVFSPVGHAHELRPTVADISASPEYITVTLKVNLEALITEIGFEHADSDDSPQSSRYDELRSMTAEDLNVALDSYQAELLNNIAFRWQSADASNNDLEPSVLSADIAAVGDTRLARDTTLVLQTARPPSARAVTWHWAEHYGPIILRADSLDASGDAFTQYLQPGETSDSIIIEEGVQQSAGSGFLDYVIIGFEHIIPKGLDHILFVIGLFLLAPRFKPIVLQVSMFTLAHTVTLALGISGVISLSAQIVEPLIALSIAVICFENLFGQRARTSRLVMVFTFGLLHGLGFAGVLSDIGLPGGRFVSSLVAFNLGVELGQLCVVLACFALVGWWFGARSWYRKIIVIPGSLVIGGVGLFWFVQRLGLV